MKAQLDGRAYIACDTETENGKAFVITTANRDYLINSFADAVKVFASLKADAFTFFNLEYDASAILKHLPQSIIEELYLDKQVKYRGYGIRYLAGKYLRIECQTGVYHCYDIYPFFQASLDDAGRKYLGVRKKRVAKSILARMSKAYYLNNRSKMSSYAIQDAKITQGLTDLIVSAINEAGLELRHLYSPGYAAKCYLTQKGVAIKNVPKQFIEFVREGYFGARIEVVKRGTFKKIHAFDIKSAYPFALTNLPNLSQAVYRKSKRIEAKYYFVRARVWMKSASSYLLPYRGKGGVISFPRYNGQTTVLTNFEYEYLKRHKLAKMQIVEVLNLFVKDDRPFAVMVEELFKRRSESSGKKILFKLILNSMYGIFAEAIHNYKPVGVVRSYYQFMRQGESAARKVILALAGNYCTSAVEYWRNQCQCQYCKILRKTLPRARFNDKPLYYHRRSKTHYSVTQDAGRKANYALAAMITAFTRVRLFDYQRKAGDKFIACFTDSVLIEAGGKIPFKTGDKLGELERREDTPLTLIGCGVYETNEETKARSYRGVKSIKQLLKSKPKLQYYPIKQLQRVSAGVMIRRPLVQYADFNALKKVTKFMNINFDKKRVWKRDFKNGGDVLKSVILSNPLELKYVK